MEYVFGDSLRFNPSGNQYDNTRCILMDEVRDLEVNLGDRLDIGDIATFQIRHIEFVGCGEENGRQFISDGDKEYFLKDLCLIVRN